MLTCKQEGGTSLSCHLIFFPPAPEGKGAALFSDADTMIVNESTAHGTLKCYFEQVNIACSTVKTVSWAFEDGRQST